MATKPALFSKISTAIYNSRKFTSPILSSIKLTDIKTPSPTTTRKMSPKTPPSRGFTSRLRREAVKSSPLTLLNLLENSFKSVSSPIFDINSPSPKRKNGFSSSSDPPPIMNLNERVKEELETNENIENSASEDENINTSECELDTPTRNKVLDKGLDAVLKMAPVIGKGSFGTVIRAVHKGHRVAAKIINKSRRRRISIDYSLNGEMNALSLNHPNIVQTLGIFGAIQEKNALVLMEFAGNKNLQMVLDDVNEVFNWERRLRYAVEIVDALCCCHNHNMVHLDLKPANVIISMSDTCKLGDFGCSRRLNEVVENYASSFPLDGTVAYKAPELLRGFSPTLKADIYSFGIVLWQLLTRETPYNDTDPHIIIYKVVACDYRPKFQFPLVHDRVTNNYTNLITTCWSSDINVRPSCSVLFEILQKIRLFL